MKEQLTIKKRLYTLKEAALYLSCSTWTVRDLVWNGTLKFIQHRPKGCIYFDLKELDAYIERVQRRYE